MTFSLSYHPKFKSEDVPRLSAKERKRVEAAILQKLMSRPELFGKPLRKSLKNYRSLRVGDWRVVYRIVDRTVIIAMVAHRSVVYEQAVLRMR